MVYASGSQPGGHDPQGGHFEFLRGSLLDKLDQKKWSGINSYFSSVYGDMTK